MEIAATPSMPGPHRTDPVPMAPETARPFSLRTLHRAARESGGLLYTIPSLVFMAFAIVPAWRSGSVVVGVSVTALCAVYSVLYVYSVAMPAYPRRVGVAWLIASWLVLALAMIPLGTDVGFFVIYAMILHVIVLRGRAGLAALGVIAVLAALLAVAASSGTMVMLTVMGLATSVGIQQGIERERAQEALAEVQERNAVLAVAAERERISRDLHDILGHSLTTITVSAQLGRRLVAADPELAAEHLTEIERIARQSLADVRATVAGMQEVRIATEIASARSVLAAAGVTAELPTAVPTITDEHAELFGYVVREGVTNVVRHANATHCEIRVDEHSVSVTDDGQGLDASALSNGLIGLRHRVESAGGRFVLASSADGTTVGATIPAATPATSHTMDDATSRATNHTMDDATSHCTNLATSRATGPAPQEEQP